MDEKANSSDSMASSDIETIDLLALFRTLKEQRRIFAGVTLASVILALAAALLITPVYQASVLVSPIDYNIAGAPRSNSLSMQLGALTGLAGLSTEAGSSVETTIATIKSRDFLNGYVHEQNLKPVLFPDRWNSDAKAWIVEKPGVIDWIRSRLLREKVTLDPSEELQPGEPTANETYTLLTEDVLTVEQDSTTSLITVSINWTEPVMAANWANALVRSVNEKLRANAIRDSERSTAYLTQQISLSDVSEVRTSLADIIVDNMKNMAIAKTQEQFALKIIDPAVAPDPTDQLRPRRLLILVVGGAVGAFLGAFAALLTAGVRRSRQVRGSG